MDLKGISDTYDRIDRLRADLEQVQRVIQDARQVLGAYPTKGYAFHIVLDFFAKNGMHSPQLDQVERLAKALWQAVLGCNYPVIVDGIEAHGEVDDSPL